MLKVVPFEVRAWVKEQLQFSNEPRLRRRVAELVDLVHPVMGPIIKSKRDFINKVVATRNYLTHWDPGSADQAAVGEELYRLAEALSVLVEACLARELGFVGDRLAGLFKENESYRRAVAAKRRLA